MKRIFHYFVIYVLSFILMFAGSISLQWITQNFELGVLKASIYAVLGLIISLGIYFVVRFSLKKLNKELIQIGNLKSLFIGLLIGFLVSFSSGIGFGLYMHYPLQFSNILSNLHINTLASVYPSLCEEVVFRGGIVNLTAQLFGIIPGVAAGSIPFGIIHILGSFFGQSVTFYQIVGISLAGAMLSLMYLRFGLLASFACHLVWNSFVGGWIKVYGITDKSAISAFEGSWITCLVLLICCAALSFNLYSSSYKKI